MTPAHYRYLLLEQGLGGALVNIGMNAAIAWLFFRSIASVPFWGTLGIASDTASTCFLLPFLTCLIVTRLASREIRRGRFPRPEWRRSAHPLLRRLPAGSLERSLVLAGLCLVVVTPLALVALALLGIQELELRRFILFKAMFAGALAAIVTPIVALCALGDLGDSP